MYPLKHDKISLIYLILKLYFSDLLFSIQIISMLDQMNYSDF